MKKIVVIYKGDDWSKEIPITSEPTRRAFEDWHKRGLELGVEFYRASIFWFDIKKEFFNKSWAFREGSWIKVESPVRPDLIFDKTSGKSDYELFNLKIKISKKIKIFNDPMFRTILDNKLNQTMLFSEFMPSTYLVHSDFELFSVLKKIKSAKVVLKPVYGSGGFGIKIMDKEKVKSVVISNLPVLVQEFISAGGIPNFSKKGELADLRLVFHNNELVYALSRIAKKGSLFTNFHQGASAVLVPKESIPKEVFIIVKNIISKISFFRENSFSLDFLFGIDGKPFLVEANTTPGFDLLKIVGDDDLVTKNLKNLTSVVLGS